MSLFAFALIFILGWLCGAMYMSYDKHEFEKELWAKFKQIGVKIEKERMD